MLGTTSYIPDLKQDHSASQSYEANIDPFHC